jgi:hypothetical protein
MPREDLMTSYRAEAARVDITLPCRQSAHLNDVRTGWTPALAGGASA